MANLAISKKGFGTHGEFTDSVGHMLSNFKDEIASLSYKNYRSVFKRLGRSLEGQVRENPYGMIRNGLAIGAIVAALNSKQLREGALYLIKSAVFQAINQNKEETI